MTRKYDSTVARIAGNLLSGMGPCINQEYEDESTQWAVAKARAIIAETKRTEPAAEPVCWCGSPKSSHCDLDELGLDHAVDCGLRHHEFKAARS